VDFPQIQIERYVIQRAHPTKALGNRTELKSVGSGHHFMKIDEKTVCLIYFRPSRLATAPSYHNAAANLGVLLTRAS
jgi:hypothetical protein